MTPEYIVEKILGKPLNNWNRLLYDKYKNNPEYRFIKDKNGNLKAVKL